MSLSEKLDILTYNPLLYRVLNYTGCIKSYAPSLENKLMKSKEIENKE